MSLTDFLAKYRPLYEADGAGNAAPADPPADPPADSPDAPVAAADQPAMEPAAPPAPKTDWRDKEIRKKHAQLKEKDTLLAQKDAELQQARELLEAQQRAAPTTVQPNATAPAPTPAPTLPRGADGQWLPRSVAGTADDPAVKAAAARLVAEQNYNSKMNTAYEDGKIKFSGEWEGALENIRTLGGFDMDTMAQILATDDPAKVLYELGKNPEQYQRLMDLPPLERNREMVKIAVPGTAPAKKTVSDFPAPVEPITSAGPTVGPKFDLYDKKFENPNYDDQWFAARAEQKKNSKGRPWSLQG